MIDVLEFLLNLADERVLEIRIRLKILVFVIEILAELSIEGGVFTLRDGLLHDRSDGIIAGRRIHRVFQEILLDLIEIIIS